jgi:hypothetical protein
MNNIPQVEKKELLSKSELSIWLDDYDDVFSDFDPRPLIERSLSDDFLAEVKKMVREKPGGDIQLTLLIPANLRKKEVEVAVIKNLHTYFKHTVAGITYEMAQARRRSILLTLGGFIIMIATAYVVSISNKSFFYNALQIILEPSGWFMVWTGMDGIIYNARRRKPVLAFNQKMVHAEITFLSY